MLEEHEKSRQLSSSASSGERRDMRNRKSRRQLRRYRKEAVRARGVIYPDPEYFLNYYQYDVIHRGEENFYDTNITFS